MSIHPFSYYSFELSNICVDSCSNKKGDFCPNNFLMTAMIPYMSIKQTIFATDNKVARTTKFIDYVCFFISIR